MIVGFDFSLVILLPTSGTSLYFLCLGGEMANFCVYVVGNLRP